MIIYSLIILMIGSDQQLLLNAHISKRFKYGILNKDPGLLTDNDVRESEAFAYRAPFNKENHAYTYWQCFETMKIKVICHDAGVEQLGHYRNAIFSIEASYANEHHDYIFAAHAIPMNDCKEMKSSTKKLIEGVDSICIAGSFIDEDTDSRSQKVLYRNWNFDRLKTKKGCMPECGHTD